jgi:hypothetical protein
MDYSKRLETAGEVRYWIAWKKRLAWKLMEERDGVSKVRSRADDSGVSELPGHGVHAASPGTTSV